MKSKKKYFFGWENIKWITKELLNMYSAKSSYFSKKRIESGVAFLVAQWGMVFFLLEKHSDLSMTDMLMWAGAEFAISGYMLAQIQKEKNGKSPASEEE
jgi:hypothetical protein